MLIFYLGSFRKRRIILYFESYYNNNNIPTLSDFKRQRDNIVHIYTDVDDYNIVFFSIVYFDFTTWRGAAALSVAAYRRRFIGNYFF